MADEENEIAFEELPETNAPPIEDPNDEKEKILKDLNEKYEKKKAEEEFRKEKGIDDPKKKEETIPPEVPAMLFGMGSKAIECEKFKLSEDEAKIVATHLNNLLPKFDSKILSAIILIIIILSKVITCIDKIKAKISGIKNNKGQYDEKTESVKTEEIVYQ